MSRRRPGALALSPLLLALPALLHAQPASPSADSVKAAIDRAFAQWSASEGPGCAVAVARDGAIVHQAGYGMANLETMTPITPASVFHLASISKQFTAASILLLARDGRLSLDDDVRKHLPELPDYGHRITIRHLLTHTSGLRDQWDLLAIARGRFEENRITQADVLEIVARQKSLNFTPGAEYLYSNTGYTLSAIIVQRVSGTSLRDFAAERIFRPLGMTETQFQDDYTRVIRDRAAGYARGADGKWHVSLPNYDTYGATSLFSTVGDLLRWQTNFDRLVVGDAAMLRDMMQTSTLTNGDTSTYGLGLATEQHRGARVVAHGGSDAGYRTWLGRIPDHGLDVAVLCNASTSNPATLARAAADVFLPASLAARPIPMPPGVPTTAAGIASLAGVYANVLTGAPVVVVLRGDSLAGRGPGPAMVPVGGRRFRMPGQPTELEFLADGTARQHFLGTPPRAPATFRRVKEWQPTRAQLAELAGTYYSEELGATYTVVVTSDSTVALRTRWAEDATVTAAYADTFQGRFLVGFTRSRGKVDGMEVSTGRVRRVRFVRQR